MLKFRYQIDNKVKLIAPMCWKATYNQLNGWFIKNSLIQVGRDTTKHTREMWNMIPVAGNIGTLSFFKLMKQCLINVVYLKKLFLFSFLLSDWINAQIKSSIIPIKWTPRSVWHSQKGKKTVHARGELKMDWILCFLQWKMNLFMGRVRWIVSQTINHSALFFVAICTWWTCARPAVD